MADQRRVQHDQKDCVEQGKSQQLAQFTSGYPHTFMENYPDYKIENSASEKEAQKSDRIWIAAGCIGNPCNERHKAKEDGGSNFTDGAD